jgi:type IX secretion system PorP/SprF family membrane protein
MLGHTLLNTALYNPSLAGADMDSKGSILLIRQECMSAIKGHPTLTLLSGDFPFKNYRIGVGGNLMVEQINFLQQIRGNAQFSYHLIFDHVKRLSFGLSTNLSYITVDESKVITIDPSLVDPILLEYQEGKLNLDFSYGMNYHSQIMACGATINNLKSTVVQQENSAQSGYYSGYLLFYIPVNFQRDILEPMITVRKLPLSAPMASFGINYAYRKVNTLGTMKDGFITGGLNFDTNLSFGISLYIQLLKRLRLGYNYQAPGRYFNMLGSTHEIVLRYNYLNLTYDEKTNEYFKWNNRKYVFRRKFKF